MEGGKDNILFGNIQQIYEWHKSTFSPELESCLSKFMLKEIKNYMEKENKDCKSINKAIEIMVNLSNNIDDMMNVGRLQDFEGRNMHLINTTTPPLIQDENCDEYQFDVWPDAQQACKSLPTNRYFR